jgi:hypothetical protein
MTAKVNYLNNKDMLLEIHRSKTSYCVFTDPKYHQYDLIVPGLDKINIRTVAEAKRVQAKRLGQQEFERRKAAGEKCLRRARSQNAGGSAGPPADALRRSAGAITRFCKAECCCSERL